MCMDVAVVVSAASTRDGWHGRTGSPHRTNFMMGPDRILIPWSQHPQPLPRVFHRGTGSDSSSDNWWRESAVRLDGVEYWWSVSQPDWLRGLTAGMDCGDWLRGIDCGDWLRGIDCGDWLWGLTVGIDCGGLTAGDWLRGIDCGGLTAGVDCGSNGDQINIRTSCSVHQLRVQRQYPWTWLNQPWLTSLSVAVHWPARVCVDLTLHSPARVCE